MGVEYVFSGHFVYQFLAKSSFKRGWFHPSSHKASCRRSHSGKQTIKHLFITGCQVLTSQTLAGRGWPPFVGALYLCIPRTTCAHNHLLAQLNTDTNHRFTKLWFSFFSKRGWIERFWNSHLEKLPRQWPLHLHATSFSTDLLPKGSFQPPDHYLWTQLSQFDNCTEYAAHA